MSSSSGAARRLYADDDSRRWFANHQRVGMSPSVAYALNRAARETDLREVFPAVRVPTLVLYRSPRANEALNVAAQISASRAMRVSGDDYFGIFLSLDAVDEIERFVAGEEALYVPESVLATIMFTDIVGSTERAAELGDRVWRDLLAQHSALVRRELGRFRGEERDTAGDGFFATFDGPARAIRCAQAIVQRPRHRTRGVNRRSCWRMRASRGEGCRNCDQRWRTRRSGGRGRRSTRLQHRPRPRCRFGHRVRKPRRVRPQRRAWSNDPLHSRPRDLSVSSAGSDRKDHSPARVSSRLKRKARRLADCCRRCGASAHEHAQDQRSCGVRRPPCPRLQNLCRVAAKRTVDSTEAPRHASRPCALQPRDPGPQPISAARGVLGQHPGSRSARWSWLRMGPSRRDRRCVPSSSQQPSVASAEWTQPAAAARRSGRSSPSA